MRPAGSPLLRLAPSPGRLGSLLALTLALAAPAARADDCKRLVDAFGPMTYGRGDHTATFGAVPAPGARYFLSVECAETGRARGDEDERREDGRGRDDRRGHNGPTRIELNGQVVLREDDLACDGFVRVELTVQASNTLRVRVHGRERLTVRVQGIVPSAALPAGAGRPVAQATLFRKTFTGRVPERRETTAVTAPTVDGLFTLRIEQGSPRALRAGLRWNGERVLGAAPIRPGRTAAEAPVVVCPGPGGNTLKTEVLGLAGSRIVVTLLGWVVDPAPPVASWTQPAPGAEVTLTSALRATYSDALSGVDPSSVVVHLDGTRDVSAAFSRDASAATSSVAAVASVASEISTPGPHTLTLRVRDLACNEATATVTFVVAGVGPDTTPPVLDQPPDLVAEQTGPAGAVVNFPSPTATDDRDPAPVVVCAPPSGNVFPPGETLVTCTATDAAGNTAQVTFRITVRDTTAPGVAIPADVVVEQATPAGTVVTYAPPLATDAVDPAPVVVCAPASGTVFPLGTTAVVCTATDAAGNAAAVTFSVVVVDTTAPALSLSPVGGGPLPGPQVSLAAAWADPVSGVDPGSFVATVDSQDETARFTVRPDGADANLALAPGLHVFQARIADPQGNVRVTSTSFEVAAPSTIAVALELSLGSPPPSRAPPDEAPLLVLAPPSPDGVRTIDGSGNDLARPDEGRAGARLQRSALAFDYADGVSALAGPGRPGARLISNAVHAQTGSIPNERRSSDFLWIWGQFLDHDLSLTRAHAPTESAPISVPLGDPFFDPARTGTATIPLSRSRHDPASSPREQTNELTAWIDGSQVYGSDPARAAALRANDGTGRLRTSPGDLLPLNTGGLDNAPDRSAAFYVAGDVRANEVLALLNIHTLFVREHNRLAGLLAARFPAATDEELYQAARRIVAAELQAITYREFLPALLGHGALRPYVGYDPNLDAGVENAFANAAFRLGHTLLSRRLLRVDAFGTPIVEGPLDLQGAFFAPERLTDGGGLEPLLRGAARQPCQRLDAFVVDGVRNFLFGQPGQGGLDLPSLNLQRGRDHGLPGYNAARRQLGLAARGSFAEVTQDPVVRARLAGVYSDVEQVDLWSGLLCEDPLPGAQTGEALSALLVRQFELLRDGDRFFYEREFSGDALAALRATRLADVIRRNTSIGAELSDDVFTAPIDLARVPLLAELPLVVRAVTATGATATSFSGFVQVSASDGKPPLDGLVLELTVSDEGQVRLPGVALFQSLGPVVVTARTIPLAPGDLDLAGALTATVVLDDPVVDPPLPAALDAGQELVVSGFSFPGTQVELVVDGQVVATAVAGPGGAYTLGAVLAPGTHAVVARSVDPVSGAPRSSVPEPVVVVPTATVALTVAPAAGALAVGETLTLEATEAFSGGAVRSATGLVAWTSLAPAVASVDDRGVVRGLMAGSATIRAELVNASGTFVATAQVAVGVPVLVESSPRPFEPDVAVTRETILRFSAPLDVASVGSAAVHAEFGGAALAGRLHLSPDGETLTLFYEQPLPASSRVRVTVSGDLLRDTHGNPVDVDRDGLPGGVARIDFDTLSLTVVPGTVVCGRVFASELAPVGTESITVPLQGVKIAVEGAEDTLFAFTDSNGDFRLDPSPAGRFFVLVDGRTATNGVPAGAYYPAVGKQWDAKAGEETNVGTSHLPLVRPGTLQDVSETEPTTISFTEDTQRDFPWLAGTRITVPPGSLYADGGARGGQVGIAPVPPDRLPGRLPDDLQFPLVITVQTNGPTNFDVPIPVRFPNLEGLAPGEKSALWSFNHDTGVWEIVGSMTVTADGLYVETDPGVGILAPGWHGWRRGVQGQGGQPGEGDEGEDPEGKNGNPECPSDGGDADCVCKDPQDGSVLLHSGEERFDRTDLMIPGRAGMDFALTRTYRSQLDYDGPLGHGWDFNFNERLFLRPNGDVARQSGGGRVDLWTRLPDGGFQAPEGFFGTLKLRATDGVYELVERDGMRRLYQPNGRLFCWIDRQGNQLGFEHDHCGDLDFALDVYGREIDFVFTTFADGKRRLTSVVDFAGREVVYTYDQQGNLTSVRSPLVVGTSTGNDFPAGRVERYGYSSSLTDPKLKHNLTSITAPEEVARGGLPWLQLTYGTDPADPASYDKVIARAEGGTNASGIPAGGTTTYAYAAINQGVSPGDLTIPRGQATITDRNGNVLHYFVNEKNAHILSRQFTRGLRPGEPAFYETRSFFDEDGQLVRRVFPEGNELRMVYDRGAGRPRGSAKDLLEVRRIAGPRGDGRGGPAEDLVTTYTYEPLYHQPLTVTDARGNSQTYAAPVPAPVSNAERYTTRYVYDYQEAPATTPVPVAVELGIDLSSIPRGLGDRNGDGRVDQLVGRVVRVEAPAVHLEPGSNEALKRGDTLQPVVTQVWWNDRGQKLRQIDAEGNVQTWTYHPDNDPDGDGTLTASLWRRLTAVRTGYLESVTVDAATSPRRTFTGPPLQLTTLYAYDPVGNVVALTNPRGVTTTSEVNALNEVVTTTRGASVAVASMTGQLVPGEQALGYRTRTFYDFNGRVVKVEEENRDGATEGVGPFVERTTVHDILGRPVETSHEVDLTTRLVTRMRYDGNQNLVEVIAPEQNRVVTAYDERDLVFTVTRGFGTPEASLTTRDYDQNGNNVRATDADDTDGAGGREQLFVVFDGFDRIVRQTDAVGGVVENEYDPVSAQTRVRTFAHPAGLPAAPNVLMSEVRTSHDEHSRPIKADAALFAPAGQTFARTPTLTDQNGDGWVTTRYEFDALGRATFVVEDDGQTTRTTYDGASRAFETVDALGNANVRTFDLNGNVVRVTAIEQGLGVIPQASFSTFYVFDQLDRAVRVSDNLGQTSRVGYDSRDNVVLRSDPEGPTTADPLGLLPQINAQGNTCRYVYDGADRLTVEVCDLRVGGTGAGPLDTSNGRNPDGQVRLTRVYDRNSRLVGLVDDNGSRTSYGYDALDRRTSQVQADGTTQTWVYDRDGNVRQATDARGSVVTKSYDALGRLTETRVTRGAGVVGTTRETFEHDGLGRLVRSTDDNGGAPRTLERSYDSLNRILEERQDGAAISHDWSGDGKRLAVTYPGGRRITNTYDALDRVATISDQDGLIATNTWAGGGDRLLRRTHANGTTLTFLDATGTQATGHDALQRVTRLRVLGPGGVALVDRSYAYNRANMRTREVRHDDRGLTDRYVYDSAYRVVESHFDEDGLSGATPRDARQASYVYDGVGNRRSLLRTLASVGVETQTYSVNAVNAYTSVAGVPQAHDDDGNRTDDGVRTYAYDYKNRLVAVFDKASGDPIARYEYDTDERRGRTELLTPGGRSTRLFYDGWRVVEERGAGGLTEVTYVHGEGLDDHVQLARTAAHPLGAGALFTHQDARDSVVAVTDAAGAVVERYRYDDFGRVEIRGPSGAVLSASAVGNPHLFQGQRVDAETGLYYFKLRHYDPATGRFLQRDLVFDPTNVGNQYTFVGNNPASLTDPTGDIAPIVVFFIIGFVVGAGHELLNEMERGCGLDPLKILGHGLVGGVIGAVAGVALPWIAAASPLVGAALQGLAAYTAAQSALNMIGAAARGDLYGVGHAALDLGASAAANRLLRAPPGPTRPSPTGSGANRGLRGTTGSPSSGGGRPGGGTSGAPSAPGVGAGKAPAAGNNGCQSGKCFVAGTKVLTAKGLERIEDIEVGDKVLARDEVTGKQGYKRVLKLNRGKAVQVCRVTVGRERRSAPRPRAGEEGGESDGEPPPDGQEILCTRDHPFYSVSRNRWVEADALEPGELLQAADEDPAALKVLAVRYWAEEVATFNFEVEDWHTYFATGADGYTSVWVHNGGKVTLQINDKYTPGGYESRQLRRFVDAWNEEIQKEPTRSMTTRDMSKASAADLAASEKWKSDMRKQFPARFEGKVVGHTPDAVAGGKFAGGRAMALDTSVNSSVGAQMGHKPAGLTYHYVEVVRGC